jgi:hypothetical protein
VDIQNTDFAAGEPGHLPGVVPVRIAFFRGPDEELVEFFANEHT